MRDFEGDTALSHACCCGSLGVAKLLVAKRPAAAGTREDLNGEKILGGDEVRKEVLNPEVEADLGKDAVMGDVTEDSVMSEGNLVDGAGTFATIMARQGSSQTAVESSTEKLDKTSDTAHHLKVNDTSAINNWDSNDTNKVGMDHEPDIKESDRGTDINTGDLDGVTPLHKAIANNWGDIVDLLLEQPHLKVRLHHHHLKKTLNPR